MLDAVGLEKEGDNLFVWVRGDCKKYDLHNLAYYKHYKMLLNKMQISSHVFKENTATSRVAKIMTTT